MPTIPTTQNLFDTNLANFESNLAQTSPLNNKAFLRVLSAIEANQGTGLYKLLIDRVAQNLALTATGTDLDEIGINYGVFRKDAIAAVLTYTLPGTNGTVIPVTSDFSIFQPCF